MPALLIRVLAEFALIAVGFYVARRQATAGMLLVTAGGLSAMITLGLPLADCAGFYVIGNSNLSNTHPLQMTFGMVAMWMLGPVSQAVNLGLIATAIVLVARDLPLRDATDAAF